VIRAHLVELEVRRFGRKHRGYDKSLASVFADMAVNCGFAHDIAKLIGLEAFYGKVARITNDATRPAITANDDVIDVAGATGNFHLCHAALFITC